MNTKDLIETLSRPEEKERPPLNPWAVASVLGLGGGVLLLMLFIGPRPDLGAALAPTLAKALFSAAFAAAGLALIARLSRPGRPHALRLRIVLAVLGFSALSALVAFVGTDPAERMRAWTGGGFPWCLLLIPFLAIPAAVALGAVVRSFAPTQLALTGAAIGAASGGFGAMAYAVRCPVDSVAFVATWYALAIALCALIGALLGSRFLRW